MITHYASTCRIPALRQSSNVAAGDAREAVDARPNRGKEEHRLHKGAPTAARSPPPSARAPSRHERHHPPPPPPGGLHAGTEDGHDDAAEDAASDDEQERPGVLAVDQEALRRGLHAGLPWEPKPNHRHTKPTN